MKITRLLLCSALLALLISPALGAVPRNLSSAQSMDLMKDNPRVFLLDVRTLEEYQQVRIEGAHLIPIDQLLRRIGELPKGRPILVYCAVGSRSSQVADHLARTGFDQVYNMTGGIMGWQLRLFPVLRGLP